MGKKRRLMLWLTLVLMCMTASAYDFKVNGVYYGIIYNNQLKATDYLEVVAGDEKYTGDVTIPATVDIGDIRYSIIRIGQDAFYDCPNLTSVSLPDGALSHLESIEGRAFGNCVGLTSIRIPDTVTKIEQFAFLECSNLKSVYIGKSVSDIGYAAFEYCESLERVEISDLTAWCGIEFHYYGTGSGWHGPESNPLSYAGHLYLNGKEVVDLVIPKDVTSIHGALNFYGCVGLESVTFPDDCNVEYIGAYTFGECSNIKTLKLNKHLKRIYDWAFAWCEQIESLVIPDEVTCIDRCAFYGCEGLKDLKLGKSLEVISGAGTLGGAFAGTSITEVTIPKLIKNTDGFQGCKQLTTINIGETSLEYIGPFPYSWGTTSLNRINITDLDTFLGIKKYDATYELYLNGQLVEDVVIPSSVSDVCENAMYGCKSLKTLTIPNHVQSMSDYSFAYCMNIKSVTSNILTPFAISSNVFYDAVKQNSTLFVPAGTKPLYQSTDGWKEFANIVEKSAVYGDVDGNNTVDENDAKAIADHIVDSSDYDASLDVNRDGQVDARDVVEVVNNILPVGTVTTVVTITNQSGSAKTFDGKVCFVLYGTLATSNYTGYFRLRGTCSGTDFTIADGASKTYVVTFDTKNQSPTALLNMGFATADQRGQYQCNNAYYIGGSAYTCNDFGSAVKFTQGGTYQMVIPASTHEWTTSQVDTE